MANPPCPSNPTVTNVSTSRLGLPTGRLGLLLGLLFALIATSQTATALNTAIPYQGRLFTNGLPATGLFDFRFQLYTNAFTTNVSREVLIHDAGVTNGLFNLTVDFGTNAFLQDAWLEVSVRPGNEVGAYELLGGRGLLLPVPYAHAARTAEELVGNAAANINALSNALNSAILDESSQRQTSLNATNSALLTKFAADLLSTTNGLSGRLIATNTALVNVLLAEGALRTNADNSLSATLLSVTNGLSARLIATNDALVLAMAADLLTTSNGLSARLVATNTALVNALGAQLAGLLTGHQTYSGNNLYTGSNHYSGIVTLTNLANKVGGDGSLLTNLTPAAVNGVLTAAQLPSDVVYRSELLSTNSALLTRLAADLLSTTNGLSGRLLATNTALVDALLAEGALRTNADNSLSTTLLSVTNGLSARLIATNDALLAAMTADLLASSTTLSTRLVDTNNALVGLIGVSSNGLRTVLFLGNNTYSGSNVFAGSNHYSGIVVATNANVLHGTFTGNGAGLTNLTPAAVNGVLTAGQLPASVVYQPELLATNSALLTKFAADLLSTTNGLSSRLIATNTALVNALLAEGALRTNADNSLSATLLSVTNGLSARLIATNDALVAAMAADLLATSTTLSTRLVDTNNLLVNLIGTSSNGLSSRLIATNDALVAFVTNRGGWTVVSGTSQSAVANQSYLLTNASLTTVTLPGSPAVGAIVEIAGTGGGGWKALPTAGQTITGASGAGGPAGGSWNIPAGSPTADHTGAAIAGNGSRLAVSSWSNPGTVRYSTDAGANWTVSTVTGAAEIQGGIAMAHDGLTIYAATRNGAMFKSSNGGGSWSGLPSPSGFWITVACSSNGQVVAGGLDSGAFYVSVNGGANWNAPASGQGLGGAAVSADGSIIFNGLKKSTDGGNTFSAMPVPTSGALPRVACSANGQVVVVVSEGHPVYVSNDGGTTWATRDQARTWGNVSCSSDGSVILIHVASSANRFSTDGGVTWNDGPNNTRGVAVSADGTLMVGAQQGGGGSIYVSQGTAASLTGAAGSVARLQYVGNNTWQPLNESQLANFDAAKITSGTVAAARLPANVVYQPELLATNTALLGALDSASNVLSGRLIATNSALLTAFAADLLSTSNGVSSRLIATNTALVNALLAEGALRTNADNSLSATLLSVTNGLSARLIATNDALVLAMAADLLSTSNGLSARLVATNTALLGAMASADTVVSNALSGRLIATNDALVALVTNRTGWTVVSGTSQSAAANQSYLLTNAAQTTVTLPVSPAVGDVVEIAGTGAGGWVATNGASGGTTAAQGPWTVTTEASGFNHAVGLVKDSAGNLFACDAFNNKIKKITPGGAVSDFATGILNPGWMVIDGADNIYVTSTDANKVVKITPGGVVSDFAGDGTAAHQDGNGTGAKLHYPTGITRDSAGNLYVAEGNGNTIRKIATNGDVTTIAGTTGQSGSTDGTGAAARFNSPAGMGIDNAGNLYLADGNNHTIRKVTPAGVVTTIAGLAGSSGAVDGTGSAARFSAPNDVKVDAAGNLLVADFANHAIRQVTPAGEVTTVIGALGSSGFVNGNDSSVRLSAPRGLLIDAAGTVYIGEWNNNAVRKAVPAVAASGGTAGYSLAGAAGTTARLQYVGNNTWQPLTGQAGNIDAATITSGTLAAARIPDLDAAKITSGTLAAARLPANVVYQSELLATNSALLTAFAADLLSTSNGVSSRLIATNTALVNALLAEGALRTNADNTLSATLLSVTNGLSARLIATNDALVLAMAADLLSTSNGLSARLVATNTALLATIDSASNGLSARLLATNDALVAFVTNRGGWTVVSGTSQSAAANQSYLLTNAAQTTVTLPASPAVGDVVEIAGTGAGGWVAQSGTSTPAGATWTARESTRTWYALASSADGTKLVAAVLGGQIYTSTDSGVTWTARESNRSWRSVASSADGTKLVAVADSAQIYTSADSGVTWTARESARGWQGVASSADGTKLVATVQNGGSVYTSTDSGVTWTDRGSSANRQKLASSSDGTVLIVVGTGDFIYTSLNSGMTWTARDSVRNWRYAAMSADGTKMVATDYNGKIYTSTDTGASWTARESNRQWEGVASSADGTRLVAVVSNGQIYTSTDSGVTWTARDSVRNWREVASSADGSKLLAMEVGGQLYTSVGAAGYSLAGAAGSVARLQYVGNNTWQPLKESQVASQLGIGRVAAANALEVEGDASKTTAGSWLANSDRRIKTNIHDLENPLAVIQKLRPVEFQYTEEYRRQHPFVGDKFYHNVIAQEFQQVFPNAVKKSGEGDILQVDTYPMFITAVGALKQLDGIVKGQATQLQQRDAELQALRRMLLQQQQALEKMREELKALQAK